MNALPNFPVLFQQIEDYLQHATENPAELQKAREAILQIHETIYGTKLLPGRCKWAAQLVP